MKIRILSFVVVFCMLVFVSVGCGTSAPGGVCGPSLQGGGGLGSGGSAPSCPDGKRCVEGACVAACKASETDCNTKCTDLKTSSSHCGKCGNQCDAGKVCVEGKCQVDCKDGKVACGDKCVDTKTDNANCGKCNNACKDGESCVDGNCESKCKDNKTECSGTCVNLQSDNNHCGACDKKCQSGEVCRSSKCEPECQQGLSKCKDICVNLNTDNSNCGECDKSCSTGLICSKGQCQLSCQSGLEKCTDRCIDIQTDNRNCGACDKACKAGEVCSQGKCQVSCQDGLAKCNNSCVNTNTDRLNCGECAFACKSGEVCNKGKCELSCPTGQVKCGNLCVDTSNDRANCGACSTACKNGEVCANSKCAISCPSGQKECTGACSDVQSDSNNCGACGTRCSGGKSCVSGKCQCPSNFTDCNGTCRNLSNDRANCGTCGTQCASGQLCSQSKCSLTCPVGQSNCKGKCSDVQVDASNCGTCGTQCTGGKVCASGKCSCPSAQKDCSGVCRNLSSDRTNCGACGTKCASGQLCSSGKCVVSCPSGQVECNGKCINTQTDNANCGACSKKCTGGNTCQAGVCKCPGSLQSCSGLCSDLQTSRPHCGKCGNACVGSQVCTKGKCVLTCPTGQVACNNVCTNTKTNRNNCGACGKSCNTGEICSNGTCKLQCPTGFSICSGKCINTKIDVQNCGKCGTACKAGEVCSNGACKVQCPTGFSNCSGSCVNLVNDVQNCGKCGTTCKTGELCISGACKLQCPVGFSNCSGTCVNLTNDEKNCGKCGTACKAGELCQSGQCKLICQLGWGACGGVCRDLQNDNNNCGKCGNVCINDTECKKGACVQKCSSTQLVCGGVCKDPQTDLKHCGKCNNACASNEACISGKCQTCTNCPLWVRRGGGTGSDVGVSIATDNKGFTYNTGYFAGSANFDLITIKSKGSNDVYVTKQDVSGKYLWAVALGGPNSEIPYGVVADSDGNVYVLGQAYNSTTIGTVTITHPKGNYYFLFVVKLDKTGKVVWVNKVVSDTTRHVYTNASLAIDSSRNLYISGRAYKGTKFDSLVLGGAGGEDLFVAKLNSAGKFQWVKDFGYGNSTERITDLKVDYAGNLVAVGYFNNTMKFAGKDYKSKGSEDAFVAKFKTSDGSTVQFTHYGGSNWDQFHRVAIDKNNNIYVTGHYNVKTTLGTKTYDSVGYSDYMVLRLTPSGAITWSKAGGNADYDYSYGIALDSSGNVYVAMENRHTTRLDGILLVRNQYTRTRIVKISPSGRNLGIFGTESSNSYTYVRDLEIDKFDVLYLTGYFTNSTSFGKSSIGSAGSNDAWVSRFARIDCPLNHTLCNGECVRTLTDRNNCGACGTVCSSSQICQSSRCQTCSGCLSKVSPKTKFYKYNREDSKGNIISGYDFGTTFNSKNVKFTSRGFTDHWVAKRDAAGKTLWSLQFGGKGYDIIRDIHVDNADNIYVRGFFYNADMQVGTKTLKGSLFQTYYLAKLSPTGTLLWIRSLGSATENSFLQWVAPDKLGRSFISGNVGIGGKWGSQSFSNSKRIPFVAQIDNATGNILWWKEIKVSRYSYTPVLRLRVTSNNEVVLGGYFYYKWSLSGSGQTSDFVSKGSNDLFVLKLKNNGDFVYFKQFGTSKNESNSQFVLDSQNNMYFLGVYSGTITLASKTITSKGSNDLYTLKLNSSGVEQWVYTAGDKGTDYVRNITISQAGNVYILGYFANLVTYSGQSIVSCGYNDYFIIKLNSAGAFQNIVSGGYHSNDSIYEIQHDSATNELRLYGNASYAFRMGDVVYNTMMQTNNLALYITIKF